MLSFMNEAPPKDTFYHNFNGKDALLSYRSYLFDAKYIVYFMEQKGI